MWSIVIYIPGKRTVLNLNNYNPGFHFTLFCPHSPIIVNIVINSWQAVDRIVALNFVTEVDVTFFVTEIVRVT